MGFLRRRKRADDSANDSLGKLISQFVCERADEPPDGVGDLWIEFMCASLFSVAWEVVFRIPEVLTSPENLEKEINALVADTANDARHWMGNLMETLAERETGGIHIEIDLGAENIRSRMSLYFNIALDAIEARQYSPETARSHACWVVLTKCVEGLIVRGYDCEQVPPESLAEHAKRGFLKCESLAAEIKTMLQ